MPLKSAVNSDEMVKKIIIIFYREFQGTRKTSLKDIKKGALIFLVLKWTGLDFFFESQRSQHEKGTKHNTMNMDDGMKESISRGIRLEWYRKCYFSSCCSHTWSHLAILLMMCWCVMTPWMKERKSTYAKDTSRNEWSRRPLPSKEKKMLFLWRPLSALLPVLLLPSDRLSCRQKEYGIHLSQNVSHQSSLVLEWVNSTVTQMPSAKRDDSRMKPCCQTR